MPQKLGGSIKNKARATAAGRKHKAHATVAGREHNT